jgi:hypothetical protein
MRKRRPTYEARLAAFRGVGAPAVAHRRRRRAAPKRAARKPAAPVATPRKLAAHAPRKPMRVQSLLFKRSRYTVAQAVAWARRHGYKYGSVEVEREYIHLRQEAPSHFRVIRTVPFGKGIKAVVGREGTGEASMKRDRKGRFLKKSHKRRARAAAPAAAPRRRRRRARAAAAPVAAPRRRRRRRHAAAPVAAPRRRRRHRARAAAPRRRRRRHYQETYAPRHYRRRRHARRNPMAAGELALAFISGGLGWAIADFCDRYLATYNPSSTAAAPTNLFTGGTNGTQANTLNIATPPGLLRIGVGIGVTIVPAVLASLVRNPMGKAALQGMMLGAGIKLFGNLWNSYVMAKLLAPANSQQATMQASVGARLYPAEVVAQQNLMQSPVPYTSPQGLNAPPAPQLPQGAGGVQRVPQGVGQGGDVGPYASPAQAGMAATSCPPGNVYIAASSVPPGVTATSVTWYSTVDGQNHVQTPQQPGPPGGTMVGYCVVAQLQQPSAPSAPSVANCPPGSVVVTASSVPPGVTPINVIWQDASGNQYVQTPQQPGPPSSTMIAYCIMPAAVMPSGGGTPPGPGQSAWPNPPMNPPAPAPPGTYAPPPQGGLTPPTQQEDCGCGLNGVPELFQFMSAQNG